MSTFFVWRTHISHSTYIAKIIRFCKTFHQEKRDADKRTAILREERSTSSTLIGRNGGGHWNDAASWTTHHHSSPGHAGQSTHLVLHFHLLAHRLVRRQFHQVLHAHRTSGYKYNIYLLFVMMTTSLNN